MALTERLAGTTRRRSSARKVRYPSSDGLVLVGTGWHAVAIHQIREALNRRFRGRKDVFIASLMALYYEEHDPRRVLYPDVMVALGEPSTQRGVYKVWEARVVPQFVVEVASVHTRDRDCEFKKEVYERIGVREYWQLDQSGLLLMEALVGHRRRRGRYSRIEPDASAAGAPIFRSTELELMLRTERHDGGLTMVFSDPLTGKDIPVGDGMDSALDQAESTALAEAKMRRAAERRARDAKQRARERRARDADQQRTRDADQRARDADRRANEPDRRLRAAIEARRALEKEVAKLKAQCEIKLGAPNCNLVPSSKKRGIDNPKETLRPDGRSR